MLFRSANSKVHLFHLLTILLLSISLIQPSQARPPKEIPSEHWQQLAQELALNEEQTESFLNVMSSQHEKRREIIEAHRMESKKKPREAMDALHQETISQLATVLTNEQLQQFEAEIEAHRKHRKMHGMMRQ